MDLSARYAKLSSCQVSDALTSVGLREHHLPGIVALEPARATAGPAMTVSFALASEPAERIEYLDRIRPGSVLVLANAGRLTASVWGGQRTLAAVQHGAAGAVVDGAYRDVEEHRAAQFPVFGRAPTVIGSRGVVNPINIDEVVTVAGVRVAPGDMIVADASGVVVVPQDRAEEVLRVAEDLAEEERRITEATEQGEDLVAYRDRLRQTPNEDASDAGR